MYTRRMRPGVDFYRLIWPAQALRNRGHDVQIIYPKQRAASLSATRDANDKIIDVKIPHDADVIVLQRITHRYLIDAIKIMRERYRVGVVIDIDDDLAAISPSNPAFRAMHPVHGVSKDHNWNNAYLACAAASWVQVSTPALLQRYAPHGRGSVVYNCVPEWYLQVPHEDSTTIGWGGSVHSHPDDLHVVGVGVSAVLSDSVRYRAVGPVAGVRDALRLPYEPESTGPLPLVGQKSDPEAACPPFTSTSWQEGLASLGVGIAPLADTRFNAGKSWLKVLEYSALGVPWVASPRAEYSDFHRRTGVGALAAKPRQWTSRLRQLTSDHDLRRDMSQRCRAAAAEWTIERNADRWLDVWRSAYHVER
jgi:hypothetical protein